MARTTYSPTDVSNLALSKIGAQTINDIQDQTNTSAVQCNLNYQLAYLAVSRDTRWNCLLATAILTEIPQIPLSAYTAQPPATSVPWITATAYTQGQYVSYGGLYYVVQNNYVSSASIATDISNGNLVLYNSNGNPVVNATPWAPLTFYPANAFLSYGDYYYQVLFDYTSTPNFTADLTAGYMIQTDQQWGTSVPDPFAGFANGSQYPSGWGYSYALPDDFVLLDSLNDNVGNNGAGYFGGGDSSEYEIIGDTIYCDSAPPAVIQYVQNVTDSTRFDPLLLEAITFKLAAMIATPLRMDGGRTEALMFAGYQKVLAQARSKNGSERMVRRFNPIGSSLFNRSRLGGING